MKKDIIDELGLLAETDKPTKSPWFLRLLGAILRKNGTARTIGGADKDSLLTRAAKGVVFFVSKLFSPRHKRRASAAAKEPLPAFLGAIFQTACIGMIAVLVGIGLLTGAIESAQAPLPIITTPELKFTEVQEVNH